MSKVKAQSVVASGQLLDPESSNQRPTSSRQSRQSVLQTATPPFSATGDEDQGNLPSSGTTADLEERKAGKPQVIIRIRPTGDHRENILEIDTESKSVQIRVDQDKEERASTRQGNKGYVYFKADTILESSTQEEMCASVANEIIDKAMDGTPGMILAVGPEKSGKSMSIFGMSGRYKNRGIVARTMEKMFEIRSRKLAEIDFRFGLGMVEVRRDKIRDLLTLSPHEITEVGDRGPKGMYIEEIDCLEHGLGLILRGLVGQKLIHSDPSEKYHTIVYLEILAFSPLTTDLVEFHSRITLVELASPSLKFKEIPSTAGEITGCFSNQPTPPPSAQVWKPTKPTRQKSAFPNRKCINPGYTQGPIGESIAVRRDIFALEQIFLKANEMYRMRRYFSKMENLGLSMIMSEKRKFSGSHNFRQNRLAHCLKDIMDNGTEIRILLHIRSERGALRSSMEAMRFAERARLVPCDNEENTGKGKPTRTEDQILQEVIQDVAPDLIHPNVVEKLNSEKMRVIQEQAVQYFENNIDAMKVCSKEKVKEMFENFRILWNFLWELELSVSLRRAQEDMKQVMQQSGLNPADAPVAPTPAVIKRLSVFPAEEQSKEVTKKASKKTKDKERKRDKKKREKRSNRESKEVVDPEMKAARDRTSTMVANSEEDNPTPRRKSHNAEQTAEEFTEAVPSSAEDPTSSRKSFVANPSEISPDLSLVQPKPTVIAGAGGAGEVRGGSATQEVPETVPPSQAGSARGSIGTASMAPRGSVSAPTKDSPKKSIQIQDPKILNLGAKGLVSESMTAFSHVTRANHHKIFLSGHEAFRDFKLYGTWGGHHEGAPSAPLTEEEITERAAHQEETISNNFEEMKKVARRQAYHLLRTGVTKPQWAKF